MKKYAIVTGASSGIGLELSKQFAADDYNLLLVARDDKELENVAAKLHSEFGAKSDILALDLSKPESADILWRSIGNKRVDAVVNNAGFGDMHRLVDAEWAKLESMIALNITTLTRLSQLAAIHMKKHKSGRILNLASTAAFLPGPGMAVYYATKAYVLSLSQALTEELYPYNISVTALCPGPTKTHFSETAGAEKSNLFKGNLPTAADVAAYGYSSLQSNKAVAVHGLKNKFFTLVTPRITPRFIQRKAVNKIQNS